MFLIKLNSLIPQEVVEQKQLLQITKLIRAQPYCTKHYKVMIHTNC